MNARDAVQTALKSTEGLLDMYVADLSDADLLVRPVPGANTIAWQLGHLITAEPHLVRATLPDAAYPELPAGFAEAHGKEAAASDSPKGFRSKKEYLELFNKTRGATLAALGKLSDADLDRPTQGQMAPFAPTLGALFILVANHTLMHAGQFTVARRKLGKPVLF
jgi:uncharacterized damage-inducible protein DinB